MVARNFVPRCIAFELGTINESIGMRLRTQCNLVGLVRQFNFAYAMNVLSPFVLSLCHFVLLYVWLTFDAGHLLCEYEYLCKIFYIKAWYLT